MHYYVHAPAMRSITNGPIQPVSSYGCTQWWLGLCELKACSGIVRLYFIVKRRSIWRPGDPSAMRFGDNKMLHRLLALTLQHYSFSLLNESQ